jgi:WD40 repeat protein
MPMTGSRPSKILWFAIVLCIVSVEGKLWAKGAVLKKREQPTAPRLNKGASLRFKAAILSLEIAGDSDLVSAALSDSTVQIWHLDTGEIVHQIIPPVEVGNAKINESSELIRAHFSPDGKALAVSYHNRIYFYDVESWREMKHLGGEDEDATSDSAEPGHGPPPKRGMTVTDFEFTSDGRRMLAAYCRAGCSANVTYDTILADLRDYGPIRLWNLETGRVEWSADSPNVVERISISPDGKMFASVSQELFGDKRSIRLFDLVSGHELYAFPPIQSNTAAPYVLFTRDSRRFVTASRESSVGDEKSHKAYCARMHVAIFQAATGEPIRQINNSHGAADESALSSDDRWLATSTCSTVGFQLWDMRTFEAVELVHPDWGYFAVDILRFSPDGRTLVAANARRGFVSTYRAEF